MPQLKIGLCGQEGSLKEKFYAKSKAAESCTKIAKKYTERCVNFMKKVGFTYLSQEDILNLDIPYKEIIDIVEGALAEHGRKKVEMPPKPGVHTRPMTFIHAMPAWLQEQDVCGIKWVSGYPENYKYDLPQIAGLLILNDPETGMPLSVMDCRWLTAVRTSAVTAVTAKYCAAKNASALTVIGAGVQGRFNAIMLKEVVPNLKVIYVSDIKEEARKKYAEDISTKLDIEVMPVSNIEEAIKNSDLVLTATQRLSQPIVPLSWLKPGVCCFGLEASRAWHGDAILGVDKFVTDDWEQTKYFASHGAFPDGLPTLHGELGEIVTGQKPGRESNRERIMAINIGMAIEDIAVAAKVYEKAVEKGVGTELSLMEQEALF